MIHLQEETLEDDYPVCCGYLYVVDGKVVVSDIQGTIRDLKRVTGGREARRCDIVGRRKARAEGTDE